MKRFLHGYWMLLLLVAFAVWANWPRELSPLKSFLVLAGFPLVFAMWEHGSLVTFRVAALIMDIVAWLLLFGICTYVLNRRIARSSRRLNRSATK